MHVSRNWLQTFFDTPLPNAEELGELLTFHSSEIEEVEVVGDDAVLDVKVLPDKSAWMLSHRGVARELATILDVPMRDPLAESSALEPSAEALSVELQTEGVSRYAAAVVRGVTVKESPEWLRARLSAIGQRPINNVVDATNYVMFHLGQPLHAFDAGKLEAKNGTQTIGVRQARASEGITTLSGETCTLASDDMVIIDATADTPIGIAGVKGGAHAAVDAATTDLIIESANFDRVMVRKTAQRLKLRTDASARYENGVVPELVSYGLADVVKLIIEIAGGTLEGYVDVFPKSHAVQPVSVPLARINSVLGLSLSADEVQAIFNRFGYEMACLADVITVTPPFERDDLVIPEDLIEEVGRIHGLEHIAGEMLAPAPMSEYNKRFYYAEQVRDALIALGFSEVFTSSFRKRDVVKLENALAADKGYLRSSLRENLDEALARNVHNKDLLGLSRIALFEIGTVFDAHGEHFSLCVGVRTGQSYKAKYDDELLNEALTVVTNIFGNESGAARVAARDGIAEIDLDAAIADLPEPDRCEPYEKLAEDPAYVPFSAYPHVTRDIALWTSGETTAPDIEAVIREHAGDFLVRFTLFDEFTKDGRTSYAFRLVFQSYEKTLTDEEVNAMMEQLYAAVANKGWDVR